MSKEENRNDMESLAYIKNQHVSPKKLRFILDAVKKESPVMAMNRLYYTQKKGAKILYKAIKSAISNAKTTLKVDENLLKFKTLLVEEGRRLKRHRAGGRGMVKPYKRRYSHIKIVLTVKKAKSSKRKK